MKTITITSQSTKILNLVKVDGLKVKIGTPLQVEKRLTREKYCAERYKLAERIINIKDSFGQRSEIEENG